MSYESDKQLASIRTEVTALGATTRLGAIAGIDRGTIAGTGAAATNTATVTAVVTGRSLLNNLGAITTTAADNRLLPFIVLTNTTTITATWGGTASVNEIVSYELVEYSA